MFHRENPNDNMNPQFTDSSFNQFSLLSIWSEYCLFFLLRVHYIVPWLLKFSRSVEKCQYHFYQGFCKFSQCFSCLTILFWNQLSYFKDNVYSSLIVEMKLESVCFGKDFENQDSVIKNPTHVIKIYSLLIVMYFENRNWPIVRSK